MPEQRSSDTFRPFENLAKLLEQQRTDLECEKNDLSAETETPPEEPETDDELFRQAMVDVKRMDGTDRVEKKCIALKPLPSMKDQNEEAYNQLKALVDNGSGFHVSQTAEYIEGAPRAVHPSILARLHQGKFTIQDYIDLHGLGLVQAEEQFHAFLKHAIRRRRQAVLIVHGRGLSSPGKPVLKTHVVKWIRGGAWRKWIIAYASARLCDGGAGATYILLRDNPQTQSKSGSNAV